MADDKRNEGKVGLNTNEETDLEKEGKKTKKRQLNEVVGDNEDEQDLLEE